MGVFAIVRLVLAVMDAIVRVLDDVALVVAILVLAVLERTLPPNGPSGPSRSQPLRR